MKCIEAAASPHAPPWSGASLRAPSPGRRLAPALLALASTAAGAAPLAADVMRQSEVYAPASECSPATAGGWISCVASQATTMSFDVTGGWGARVAASSSVGLDSMQAHLQGVTHSGWDAAYPMMDVTQFDTLTVTGPTTTVPVGISVHIVGSGAPSSSDYASGTWTFTMGARNPSPAPDYGTLGDWLSPGFVFRVNSQLWSTSSGPVHPTIDQVFTSSMTLNTGQPTELGSELFFMILNMNVNFTQVQWSFDVPAGYQLTSVRGLSVGTPPVPEPGAAAMLLAGLGLIGWFARRRRVN
jgi:hypothetical protein